MQNVVLENLLHTVNSQIIHNKITSGTTVLPGYNVIESRKGTTSCPPARRGRAPTYFPQLDRRMFDKSI